MALLGGEFGRHFDGDADEELSVAGSAEMGHAFAAEFEDGAGLRAGGDFDGGFAVEGGDMDLAAERGGDKGHRHVAEEVFAVTGEDAVLADVDDDVKVTGGGAADAGFAIAAGAEAGAVLDAGGDFEFDARGRLGSSVAAADFARVIEHLARAVAAGAGLGDLEKAA